MTMEKNSDLQRGLLTHQQKLFSLKESSFATQISTTTLIDLLEGIHEQMLMGDGSCLDRLEYVVSDVIELELPFIAEQEMIAYAFELAWRQLRINSWQEGLEKLRAMTAKLAGKLENYIKDSVLATLAGLETASRVAIATSMSTKSCILGGSCSYGRFATVRGNLSSAPSDLDLMLVVARDSTTYSGDILNVLKPVDGVDFEKLCDRFNELRDLKRADILVSEFIDPISNLPVAVTLIDEQTFVSQLQEATYRVANMSRDMQGIFHSLPPECDWTLLSSFGEEMSYRGAVTEEGLYRIRSFEMQDGVFFPGAYLTFLAPYYEVLHGDKEVLGAVLDLKSRLIDDIFDREFWEEQGASSIRSHFRFERFPLYVLFDSTVSTLIPPAYKQKGGKGFH